LEVKIRQATAALYKNIYTKRRTIKVLFYHQYCYCSTNEHTLFIRQIWFKSIAYRFFSFCVSSYAN